ncbi:MAG: hypothetical protein HZB16_16835, partial [Armatimonadetes bacterium]|nr:hypothetical protein [Armatimonadota bacterium]
MTRWTYRAALIFAAAATCGPLWAQTEVPAIINTYRANPLEAAGISRTHGAATFSLSADQVRELTYRCYIAGTMQGVPDATGTFGLNSATQPYPVTAPQLTSSERMPAMPLVRRAGPDGIYGTNDDELILYVELRKLPLQATCDKVVENLRNLGLASKLDGAKPMSFDAAATGNWRILVHPPAGKGAPPAPGVYYPEAIGAVTPSMTKAQADAAFTTAPHVNAIREFWGRRAAGASPSNSLEFRYTGWSDWVRNAWVNGNQACHVAASVVNGVIPLPFYVKDPNFARIAENNGGVNRLLTTGTGDRDICLGTMFFDPNAMWENRRLDADGTIVDPAADLTNAVDWIKRRPTELPEVDAPAARPIEVLFRFAAAADPGAANWYLRGIHSTAEATQASVDATMVLPTAGTLSTTNGFSYYPAPVNAPVIEVNLLNGLYRLSGTAAWLGTAVRRPAYAGVGMVELQFEYETGVPVESINDLAHTQWSGTVTDAPIVANNGGPWPFGWDDRLGGNDDALAVASWNLPGPDGNKGSADDQVILASDLAAHAPTKMHVVSGQTVGATYARDPLNVRRNGNNWEAAADTNVWKVRRFCSWPYNGNLLGTTGSYQGGPLVCRYMVSSVQVLPQDADTASSASATLSKLAQYDPANGGLYPQLKTLLPVMSTVGTPRDVSGDHERPNFLLGYLPDGGVLNPVEDYFLPVSPGAKSPMLRFYVQTMLDGGAGGGNQVWTAADRLMEGPRDVRKGTPDDYLGYNFSALSATNNPDASLIYWYDIHRSHNNAGTQSQTSDTQVRDDDDLTAAATVLDQRRAFDGDTATATTLR